MNFYIDKNDFRPPESINVGVVYNLVRKQH